MSNRGSNQNKKFLWKRILTAVFIFWIILGVGYPIYLHYSKRDYWATINVHHTSSVSPLWSLEDIFIGQNKINPYLVSGNDDSLIFLGSIEKSNPGQMIALQKSSGKALWRKDYVPGMITISGTTVLAGGAARVTAYDSTDGHLLWDTMIFGNGVNKMSTQGDIVYFSTAGALDYYAVDIKRGKLINKFKGIFPFRNDVNSGYVGLFGNYCGDPMNNPLSNVSLNSEYAFAICENGWMVRFNLRTKEFDNYIQYDPVPFQTTGEYNKNLGYPQYAYYTAIDDDRKLLFAYLGDSAQLFAYQLKR